MSIKRMFNKVKTKIRFLLPYSILKVYFSIKYSFISLFHSKVIALDTECSQSAFSICSNNIHDYQSKLNGNTISKMIEIMDSYNQKMNQIYPHLGKIKGRCNVCNKSVSFIIERSIDKTVPWRGTLICPKCGFNLRTRRMVEEICSSVSTSKKIYVTEQSTLFYKWLKTHYPNTIGSEFLSNELSSGEKKNGFLHEDLMSLSFSNCEYDIVISCDVLEHVFDHKKAISEVYRILKSNGVFLFSVPFYCNRYKNEVRAIKENGRIIHLMKPEIHGNPIDANGSLVFTTPGWEMIDYCKSLFQRIDVLTYFSVSNGYLGNNDGTPQVLFKAFK